MCGLTVIRQVGTPPVPQQCPSLQDSGFRRVHWWRHVMQRFLKQAWLKFFILIIGLLAAAQAAQATTVVMPSDDQMVISARAIITGKVLSIESSYDETSDRVFSYITVKVKEVLKGQI